jgi:cyclopropane fatty-acyl-phospholipid synthase-like methyltransferase
MAKIIDKLLSRDEHVCPWWMAWTFDNPLRKLFQDPERILGSFVREGMTVADIGCGMGYFSVAMAKMIGPGGRVLSVDLQEKMLQYLKKRAVRAGVQDRITTILAEPDDIKISGQVDFLLAFWMVHEVKDIPRFFDQVAAILKPGGKVLYVEPRMHVTQKRLEEILGYAKAAGFAASDGPKVSMSRSAVLERTQA